jgi:hypothetical protein
MGVGFRSAAGRQTGYGNRASRHRRAWIACVIRSEGNNAHCGKRQATQESCRYQARGYAIAPPRLRRPSKRRCRWDRSTSNLLETTRRAEASAADPYRSIAIAENTLPVPEVIPQLRSFA